MNANQTIELKWLMTSTKRQIVQENLSSILRLNNTWEQWRSQKIYGVWAKKKNLKFTCDIIYKQS